jgi:hypothetical protein
MKRLPTLLGSLKCVFTLVILLLTAGSATAQTEVTLPAPTGQHKIGRTSFHWKDSARDELETSAPDDKRELMVHLFYPADAKATGAPAVYVPDADAMRGLWNDAQLARIIALRTHSRENAPLPRGKARYPVALFSPGGGLKALTYHALLEDLASHGWVVAAVDPPYNARALRFPDGRVLGNLQPNERGWPQPRNATENQRFYQERIAHWSRDISFVIDQLTALDKGKGPFAKRLDWQRGVGVFGHSRGGQAAATVRILDSRVRGGINLDGMMGEFAVLPAQAGDTAVGAQPFLWIHKPLPPPPSDEQLQRARRTRAEYNAEIGRVMANWQRQLSAITGGALRLTMNRPGIQHIDFSDEPYWDGTMTEANRPGRLQTIADTRKWVRAFFDGTVRGDWTNFKRLANDKSQPEVTVHSFGKLWP